MIGAIIGDVVGSRFEFNNIKTKDFELVSKESKFTDDTVLTIALLDWVLHENEKNTTSAAKYLQKWARRFPYAGYGNRFISWIYEVNPKPYNSCGNGSAMRISGVGWAYADDTDDLLNYTHLATACTHNHPEGLKGAIVVARCIAMALEKCDKKDIRDYAVSEYPEIATLDYEELRRTYKHDSEICQTSVPQAIYCFLISTSFEDCLRTTISIGGDCDTTAAMSCAIAEAYYGDIPAELVKAVRNKLPERMLDVIDEFKEKYGGI